MSLESALSIATGGLANVSAQLALVSQNVANAGTPAYAVETSTQESLSADGIGLGVHTGLAKLQINQALTASLTQQNAVVSGLTTTPAMPHSNTPLSRPPAPWPPTSIRSARPTPNSARPRNRGWCHRSRH